MNGKLTYLPPSQLERAATFIEELNNIKASHIGYCGTSYNDLLHTLQIDFVEGDRTSIYVQMNEGEIVSLIALDIDDDVAEVWGPFTKEQNESELRALWEFAKSHHSNITQYNFFINELNTQQIKFMDSIGSEKSGEHCYLKVTKETFVPVPIHL